MAGAEVVFVGGWVYAGGSGDDGQPRDVQVAVAGGRVMGVGDEVAGLRRRGTRIVDLAGGLLLPGFTDAHVHPVYGGLERMRCDLSELEDRDAYLAAVRSYARSHPGEQWVNGRGWSMAAFPGGVPQAADLDAVVPDRPAFLSNRDHHGAWVNTVALQLAGIDARTPDPSDGRIERDAAGRPSGTLHEGAMALVSRLLPPTTHQDHVAALLDAQAYLHSFGVTAWQDAIVGAYANADDVSDAYLETASDGRLTARVVGALWWDRERGAEQIPELAARRTQLNAGRFRATSVKIMQDGIVENYTAGMVEPYLDARGSSTQNRGLSFVEPAALREHVVELDAHGFQVHVHAIGDRAVREALDAFAAARERNGARDARHHIAHVQVVQPQDVWRFGELGVTATMQPLWAAHEAQMDQMTIPFLGPERSGWQYPFASLHRSGGHLAAGSDWPVSSPDPLAGIHVAVNRRAPDATAEVPAFLPDEALDLASALSAYTRGSAFLNHADDTGRIQVGALADFAVLDRNPFAGPVAEIADARVVATFVEGREVYTA